MVFRNINCTADLVQNGSKKHHKMLTLLPGCFKPSSTTDRVWSNGSISEQKLGFLTASVFFNGEGFSSVVNNFLRGEVLRPSTDAVNEEAFETGDLGVTCWVFRLMINAFVGEDDLPALSAVETNGAKTFLSHTLPGEPLQNNIMSKCYKTSSYTDYLVHQKMEYSLFRNIFGFFHGRC